MITPNEIVYWEILPAIRRELVFSLKTMGLKQKEIANLLDVTPSAISQYMKSKRGNFEFTEGFREDIKNSANIILNQKKDPFLETNKLIKKFEKDRHICKVCTDKNQIKHDCSICFE